LVRGEGQICLKCSHDLPVVQAVTEVEQRLQGRVPLEEIRAFLYFQSGGLTQRLLHDFKYKGNTELGQELARAFGRALLELKAFRTVDLIVPVPLHSTKTLQRGFNQSEVIARQLGEVLSLPVSSSALKRHKKSETQTRKAREDRWRNVENIFSVVSKEVRHKHLLLVDDVITTGATLESCSETLIDAGAGSISVAVLAMAT